MLRSAYPKVIATHVTVQVVVEGALLAVLKQDTDQAGAANADRSHLFYDDSFTPLSMVEVSDFITEAKVEALPFVHRQILVGFCFLVVADNTGTKQEHAA
ncbi:MAG: hypothetical protein ACRERD_15750 [Candidatus Binatia bacterium]